MTTNNTPAKEECWDLPEDFKLFAQRDVGKVYYPTKDGSESEHFFQIECIEPESPLDILNYEESARQYDATGHCVWSGAFLLISVINELEKFLVGKTRIIEFGCGTGISGLSLILANNKNKSSTPPMVCFTDNDPDALNGCKRNCELNNISEELFSIQELTWGDETNEILQQHDGFSFDVALATDVLYDVELIDPLFTSVVGCLSNDGGILILSHIPRACYNDNNPPAAVENLEKYIIDQAKKHGLGLSSIIRPPRDYTPHEEMQNWCPENAFSGGAVLIFRRS